METTSIVIEQLERKLSMLKKAPTPKKVIIGFGSNPILASALNRFGIESTCLDMMGSSRVLSQTLLQGDLMALMDLANLRNAESMLEGVLEGIIKPSGRTDFMFLFALGDPSKKTPFELDEILDLISSFSFYGHTTLALNGNEAVRIWSSLTGLTQRASVEEAGRFIHYAMDVDRLLIYSVDKTIVFQMKDTVELHDRFVVKPKTQAEAGDKAHAGYIFGILSGFSLEESMILGMAASESYIQEGRSATLADIERYLSLWRETIVSKVHVTHTPHAA
jgi:hypothetical protein